MADATGNGNNGTLQGASWSNSISCCTLDFNGSNNYVSVTSNPLITNLTNNFTLAFWAYPRSAHEIDTESASIVSGVSGQKYVWGPSWYDAASGAAGAGVSVGTNGVSVYEHADEYMPATLVYQAALDGWTHVALVYENKQPRLYINGSLVRTGLASPKSFVHITPSNLGGAPYGFFDGQLKDVRLYNGALSAGEIQTLGTKNRTPIANAGGPYISDMTQPVHFDGTSSTDIDGTITNYAWDFGDGSTGTGPTPTHAYDIEGSYSVTLTVTDNNGASSSASANVGPTASQPVTLNFDDLPNNTIVTQYRGVGFQSNSYYYPVHTHQSCGFCGTTSPPNFITTKPDDYGQITFDFPEPENNLTFYIIGVDTFSGVYGKVDIYQNGSYATSYDLVGVGTSTVRFTPPASTVKNITKLIIYNQRDALGIGIDDIIYTPADVERVEITSPRVSGTLGTPQNALLGADVSLQSKITPSGLNGGSYSWTFPPTSTAQPVAVVGGSVTSSSMVARWLEPGSYPVKLTYTRNNVVVTSTLTVNVALPKLTSFTANQAADRVAQFTCDADFPVPIPTYMLGCPPLKGMAFTTTAQIPSGSYISNPAQSGIKYVQIVSSLRKRIRAGNVECETARSSESSIDSGWQLDTSDPVNDGPYPVHRFSEGNTIMMPFGDSPSVGLDITSPSGFVDAMLLDERFETYVVYFTGNDPRLPIFQRPIGLQNSSQPVARIAWKWGGQVFFDPALFPQERLQSTLTAPGAYTAESVNAMRPYGGNVHDLDFTRCPGGPTPTTNQIDGTRFFVRQQYLDLYGRPPDQGGWDYWTGEITRCAFDRQCVYGGNGISGRRLDVALAFFYESEIVRRNPDLANPPGSPNFNPDVYNPAFIKQCYNSYLLRDPEPQGQAFWVDVLNHNGDYQGVVNAFITTAEYRARFGPP